MRRGLEEAPQLGLLSSAQLADPCSSASLAVPGPLSALPAASAELDNVVELLARFSLASLPGVGAAAGVPTATARLRHTFSIVGSNTVEICFTGACAAGGDGWGAMPVHARGARAQAVTQAAHGQAHSVSGTFLSTLSLPPSLRCTADTEVRLAGGLGNWLNQVPTLAAPKLPDWLQVSQVRGPRHGWGDAPPPAVPLPGSRTRAAPLHLTMLSVRCRAPLACRRPPACVLHALMSSSSTRACASRAGTE